MGSTGNVASEKLREGKDICVYNGLGKVRGFEVVFEKRENLETGTTERDILRKEEQCEKIWKWKGALNVL